MASYKDTAFNPAAVPADQDPSAEFIKLLNGQFMGGPYSVELFLLPGGSFVFRRWFSPHCPSVPPANQPIGPKLIP